MLLKCFYDIILERGHIQESPNSKKKVMSENILEKKETEIIKVEEVMEKSNEGKFALLFIV